MKHHRMILAALAASMLSAGHALALQDTPAAAPGPAESNVGTASYSTPQLVAEINELGLGVGNQIALADPDGLIERLQAHEDRLNALGEADGGIWDFGIAYNISTDAPETDPCDDATALTVMTGQGVELAGTLCRITWMDGDLPVLARDQIMLAPFDGQTLYIRVTTSLTAERDGLREAGSEILSAIVTELLHALVLTPEGAVEGSFWRTMLQELSDEAAGYMHFHEQDALVQALEAGVADLNSAAERQDARWGITFSINGEQYAVADGVLDPVERAAIARPATPAWCQGGDSVVLTDPAGIERIWHECGGVRPTDDAATLSHRQIWTEESADNAYHWVELTAVGSTDTPSLQPELEATSRAVLALIIRNLIIDPSIPVSGDE